MAEIDDGFVVDRDNMALAAPKIEDRCHVVRAAASIGPALNDKVDTALYDGLLQEERVGDVLPHGRPSQRTVAKFLVRRTAIARATGLTIRSSRTVSRDEPFGRS